jgi:hypothetical protein
VGEIAVLVELGWRATTAIVLVALLFAVALFGARQAG